MKQLYFDRITRYLDSWPKIEKWYNKFGVLTTVDASQGMQTVFLEVEKILEDTLAKVKLENQSLHMFLVVINWNNLKLFVHLDCNINMLVKELDVVLYMSLFSTKIHPNQYLST